MDRIRRRIVNVYLKDEGENFNKIFTFFEANSEKYNPPVKHLVLYDKVLIINFIPGNYFFFNIDKNEETWLNYHQIVKTKYLISNYFLNLSNKILNSISIILIINSQNAIYIKKFLFNKFLHIHSKISENISNYTKIYAISTRSAGKFFADEISEYNKYSSFFEFNRQAPADNPLFCLITRKSVFLFEKLTESSVLLQTLDISFTSIPYPISISNNLYIISTEQFVYKLQLTEKNKTFFSIFKDMTLNFNNEKYEELLDTIRLILHYNLEVDEIPFKELKLCMLNIFQEYDIFSYVENLTQSLNEENILFFLSYNMNNSKLFSIILYTVIFENYEIMTKIFKLLLFNKGKTGKSLKHNMHFMSFLILFQDFLIDFFSQYKKIKFVKELLPDVNRKIFSDLGDETMNMINQNLLIKKN